MIKRIVLKLIITVAGVGWLFFGLAASAHTTETVGTLSLLLHVEPGDRAIAGSPATIHVTIADTAGKFQPGQCDCRIQVSRDGQVLADLSAQPESPGLRLKTVGAQYTFAAAGDYDVVLDGKPRAGATFEPFIGRFDTTVYTPARQPPWLWLVVPGALLGVALGGLALWLALRGRRTKSSR